MLRGEADIKQADRWGRAGGKLRSATRLMLWNLSLMLLGILAVDLIFGSWVHEGRTRRLGVERSVSRTWDVSRLYGQPGTIARYSRDAFGFRGLYGDVSDIDILTLGGSTTAQRAISDEATWQSVLAREARANQIDLRVANAGIDGHSTLGHLRSFEHWLGEIEDLTPRIFIFYVGINDALLGYSGDFGRVPDGLRGALQNRSAVYDFLRRVRGALRVYRFGVGGTHYDWSTRTWTERPLQPTDTLAAAHVADYRARVGALAARARDFGATPVFVTQPDHFHTWNGDIKVGLADTMSTDIGDMNGLDFHLRLSALNRAMLQAASAHAAVGLDLAGTVAFAAEDFYDPLHNTPLGAEKIGRFLFRSLLERGLLAPDVASN
jgi:lysophospholipase L1-like esterase